MHPNHQKLLIKLRVPIKIRNNVAKLKSKRIALVEL